MTDECPFCSYDGPNEILFRGTHIYVVEPINPVVEGHVLVIPFNHVEDATQSMFLTGEVMAFAGWWVKEKGIGDANLITSIGPAATQTVRHMHVHVVPRFDGDGLMLPWSEMP